MRYVVARRSKIPPIEPPMAAAIVFELGRGARGSMLEEKNGTARESI
jgi:hypothetical protein